MPGSRFTQLKQLGQQQITLNQPQMPILIVLLSPGPFAAGSARQARDYAVALACPQLLAMPPV